MQDRIARIDETSCTARPDHTSGSIPEVPVYATMSAPASSGHSQQPPRHLTQRLRLDKCPSKSWSPRDLLPRKASFPSRARKLTFHNKTDFEKSIIHPGCTRADKFPPPLLWPKQ